MMDLIPEEDASDDPTRLQKQDSWINVDALRDEDRIDIVKAEELKQRQLHELDDSL